jgi:hypothetical protein
LLLGAYAIINLAKLQLILIGHKIEQALDQISPFGGNPNDITFLQAIQLTPDILFG